MATTPRGFRKPASTDKVKNGYLAIDQLADDVDSLVGTVRRGHDSITTVAANTPVTKHQTFLTPFPVGTTPQITLGVNSGVPHNRWVGFNNVTNTGFDAIGSSTAAATIAFDYIAIG